MAEMMVDLRVRSMPEMRAEKMVVKRVDLMARLKAH